MINILDISKDRAQKSRINIDAIGFLQAEIEFFKHFKSNFFIIVKKILQKKMIKSDLKFKSNFFKHLKF